MERASCSGGGLDHSDDVGSVLLVVEQLQGLMVHAGHEVAKQEEVLPLHRLPSPGRSQLVGSCQYLDHGGLETHLQHLHCILREPHVVPILAIRFDEIGEHCARHIPKALAGHARTGPELPLFNLILSFLPLLVYTPFDGMPLPGIR